ncbi:hypothetical protein N7475_010530 [Penicillium sp. IBT 31633x]|nr:hypothetical protein N7475_010530 [Penicillium sp. IBT 31633x]
MSRGISDNHTVLLAALDAPRLTGRPMETMIPVIKFLLEKRANPNGLPTINTWIQRRPFMTAIETGNVEAAILLVEYGATVDLDSVLPVLLRDTERDWTRLIELLQSDRTIA